jgi:bifunctional non-homologous end joining protein LigD
MRWPACARAPAFIDGEAVACGDDDVAELRLHPLPAARCQRLPLRLRDLIELNGDDMRRDLLEVRKATLRSMLAKAGLGLRFNEHIEGDGPTVFAHACKMGLEGIVSKRKDSPYRSGRSPDWLKMKNTAAPAVKREAEEDWSKERWCRRAARTAS